MSKKSRIYILQAGHSLNGVHFVTPPGRLPPKDVPARAAGRAAEVQAVLPGAMDRVPGLLRAVQRALRSHVIGKWSEDRC